MKTKKLPILVTALLLGAGCPRLDGGASDGGSTDPDSTAAGGASAPGTDWPGIDLSGGGNFPPPWASADNTQGDPSSSDGGIVAAGHGTTSGGAGGSTGGPGASASPGSTGGDGAGSGGATGYAGSAAAAGSPGSAEGSSTGSPGATSPSPDGGTSSANEPPWAGSGDTGGSGGSSPETPGSDDPGNGWSTGEGGASGSTGTAGGASDLSAAALLSASRWPGRWGGGADYEEIKIDGIHVDRTPKTIPVEVRIDSSTFDKTTGRVSVTGRVAVGFCLISAEMYGEIFLGDELSPVRYPQIYWQSVGQTDTGNLSAVRITGQFDGTTITAILDFVSPTDKRQPCFGSGFHTRIVKR